MIQKIVKKIKKNYWSGSVYQPVKFATCNLFEIMKMFENIFVSVRSSVSPFATDDRKPVSSFLSSLL